MPTKEQRKQLQLALISAFPERSLLEQLLDYELDKKLNRITQDSNLETVVYQLIQRAQAEGWLIDLVRAARKENPGNSELAAIALELLSLQTSSAPLPKPSSSATVTKLKSTQQRKILVSGAAVATFILIAGGTILVFNFVSETQPTHLPPSISSPRNSTTPAKPLLPTSEKRADNLYSEKGIDYTQLQNLLTAGQWKQADYETYLLMLRAVNHSKGDEIRPKELLNFPCTDLDTIDRLWEKHSNGRFGFSVQKQIYLEVGGLPDGKYNQEAWEKFGDRVGWRVKESWIDKDKATFNTKAPRGHLPGGVGLNGGDWEGWNGWSLWSRLNDCHR